MVTVNLSHDDTNPRTHTCLSQKVYSKFGFDSANGFDDNQEIQDLSSDEDNVPSSANRQRSQPSRLGPTSTNSASNLSQSATATSAAVQRSSSVSTITSVPSVALNTGTVKPAVLPKRVTRVRVRFSFLAHRGTRYPYRGIAGMYG